MKKFKLALLSVAAAAVLLPAAAQAQVSFNVGAVSLYKSRGVDQEGANKNWRPALQGGVDYGFANGFYVGNWNSTGQFGAADLEIDLYGGYAGEITKGLGFDVGYIRYVYPDQASWNGDEVYFKLSYDAFSAKIVRGISGSVDEQSHLDLGYTRPLNDKLTLKAGVGFRNNKAGNFDDYSIGLDYALGNALTLSASLSGASKQAEAGDGSRDSRLVVGLTKAF